MTTNPKIIRYGNWRKQFLLVSLFGMDRKVTILSGFGLQLPFLLPWWQ
jgi:hypothetical protein